MRLGAVFVGFAGVVIMQRPWASAASLQNSRIALLLPAVAALPHTILQLMTRKLGATTKASALAVYIQGIFIIVSLVFGMMADDGRFAEGSDNASIQFLFRAWIRRDPEDWGLLLGLGFKSATIGYCLGQAYRLADAATVAPFEYAGLPLAVFWS